MRTLLPLAAVALLAVPVAGCGSSNDDAGAVAATATPAATTPAATTPVTDPAGSVTIHMSEFAFDPKDATATAGPVTLVAPNDGRVVHELVLLRTDADPAHLPMKGGEVDESTSVGEIADVEPGSTKKTTLKLAPGKYVMVCALPGHYQSGMYGSLTVR